MVGHGAGCKGQGLTADAGVDSAIVGQCSRDRAEAVDGVWAVLSKRTGHIGVRAAAVQVIVPVPDRIPPLKVMVEKLELLLLTVMAPLSTRFPVTLRSEAPTMSNVELLVRLTMVSKLELVA